MVIRQADVVKCVDNAERKVPPLRLASPHYGRDDSGVKAALRCWQKKRVLRCAQDDKGSENGHDYSTSPQSAAIHLAVKVTSTFIARSEVVAAMCIVPFAFSGEDDSTLNVPLRLTAP